MVNSEILYPIEWAVLAAKRVAKVKSDESVRICGDFKVSVNSHLNVNFYPLPIIDRMLATMAGGSRLTKLYSKTTYLQMEVYYDSKKLFSGQYAQGTIHFWSFGIRQCPGLKAVESNRAIPCGNW